MLKLNAFLYSAAIVILSVQFTQGQSYENARCNCICTSFNDTKISRKQYIASVPSDNDCDSVSIPEAQLNSHSEKLCPVCRCKYESRNTTTIKFVVIFVVWVISLLLIYMMILICLDNSLNIPKRKSNYVEHTNEEDESPSQAHPSGISSQLTEVAGPSTSGTADGCSSGNVLNRVSHHQDKWKRQVREQRKNIYDRHTMLN